MKRINKTLSAFYFGFGLVLIALATMFGGCRGNDLTTEEKTGTLSGWAPYDKNWPYDASGVFSSLYLPAISVRSDDGRVTLYRDSVVVRDSVNQKDSTIYMTKYHVRDSVAIHDSTRWNGEYKYKDRIVREDYPFMSKLGLVLLGMIVLLVIYAAAKIMNPLK